MKAMDVFRKLMNRIHYSVSFAYLNKMKKSAEMKLC